MPTIYPPTLFHIISGRKIQALTPSIPRRILLLGEPYLQTQELSRTHLITTTPVDIDTSLPVRVHSLAASHTSLLDELMPDQPQAAKPQSK